MSSKPEPNSYEHTTTFSTDVLAEAAALKVVDQKGNAVMFGSLFEEQRTIMVFVRTSSNAYHVVSCLLGSGDALADNSRDVSIS
jgi:hypothetical protein